MEITLKDLKYLIASNQDKKEESGHFFTVGENYFIRTVTMYYTGELAEVGEKEIVLRNAAWIADTGRFSENLKTCEFNEVEMFPSDKEVIVGRGALLDAVIIDKLPTETK